MSKTTERTATVWPSLRYRDARAAIRFLVDAFGFEEVASYAGSDESVVVHAELRWPEGGGVMLGSYHEESDITMPPGVG
ncbi:MAG: glyoxalase, partial [Candidatus Dormibacteraeota bacterium]|nr:glyoxalase [Candidatus Dormibacteraeota bacterium]